MPPGYVAVGAGLVLLCSVLSRESMMPAFLRDKGFRSRPGLWIWETSEFNSLQRKIGRRYRGVMRLWFAAGVPVACLCGLLAAALILHQSAAAAGSLFTRIMSRARNSAGDPAAVQQEPAATRSSGAPELQLVLPGATVPWSDLPALWMAAASCMAVHEAGHALAAGAEGVPLQSLGFFIAAGLVPGAFVSLGNDSLHSQPLGAQLRILTAGAWNNFAFAAAAAVVLYALLPGLLSIGWSSGLAASVVSVEPWSPLAPHLLPGAAIVAVGGCRVTGAASWLECVSEAFLQPEQGYEVPVDWTRDAERCLPSGAEGPGCSDPNQLCFKSSADCELSGCSEACLSARRVVSLPTDACLAEGRRQAAAASGAEAGPAASVQQCMTAASLRPEERLLAITVLPPGGCPWRLDCLPSPSRTGVWPWDRPPWTSVLYVGPEEALLRGVSLSDHIPRAKQLPVWLPGAIEGLLRYTVSMSASMAVLNMAPVFGLDGHPALEAMVRSLSRRRRRKWITSSELVSSVALAESDRTPSHSVLAISRIVSAMTALLAAVVLVKVAEAAQVVLL